MAKTTTVTKTVKIVDLIRKRNEFQFIEVPAYPVQIDIDVTTSALIGTPAPAPSAALERLAKVAREKFEEYEDIITKELVKIEKKIADLMQQPSAENAKKAEQMVREATMSVKNALASAQGAAEQAVEQQLAKEGQRDQLLREARVKTGFKVVSGTISLGSSVAKLVATMGADVTSYLSIAKTLVELGLELKQQLKGEEKLRKDLKEGVNAFLDLRSNAITQAMKNQKLTDLSSIPKHPRKAVDFIAKSVMAAGEEVIQGRSAKDVAKEVLDFVVKKIKSEINNAEKSRVAYREHTTKMRHKTDGVSSKADDLDKKMKSARNLQEGVKVGAECMKLKGQVRKLQEEFYSAESFLGEMQSIMEGGGLDCDDATVLQKLKQLDVSTIKSGVESVSDLASGIHDLVKNVASAVA